MVCLLAALGVSTLAACSDGAGERGAGVKAFNAKVDAKANDVAGKTEQAVARGDKAAGNGFNWLGRKIDGAFGTNNTPPPAP